MRLATRPTRRPLPPPDPALPALTLLDDVLLARALAGTGCPVERARVGYLELVPGSSLVLQAEVVVDGVTRPAVVRCGRAVTPLVRPSGTPLPGLDAVLHWLPADPDLPMVAAAAGALPARLLAYVPGRRATLALPPYVLKTYATDAAYRSARTAMGTVAGALPTPGLVASIEEHRTLVQRHVAGTPAGLDDAVEVAATAGRLLAGLHASQRVSPVLRDPARQLHDARTSVELLCAVLPAQAERAGRLLARLAGAAPAGLPMVLSHGDFTVDQMLRTPGGDLVVTDVDDAAQAPEALDVAAFAANVVSGREDDAEHSDRVLAALVAATGHPPALEWHLAVALLRRCDRPFRRWKKHWPQKSEAILDLVEEKASTSCP